MKRSVLFLMLLVLMGGPVSRAQSELILTVSFPGDLRSETVNVLINDFVAFKADQGISVNVVVNEPTDGYEDQLLLDFASGISPDVFAISPNSIAEFASAGLMLTMDGYVDEWDEWWNFPQGIKNVQPKYGQFVTNMHNCDEFLDASHNTC